MMMITQGFSIPLPSVTFSSSPRWWQANAATTFQLLNCCGLSTAISMDNNIAIFIRFKFKEGTPSWQDNLVWPISIPIFAGQGHIEEVLISISSLNPKSNFQTSQISVAPSRAQHSWYEPVNWFTKEQEIWTVTTFTFAFTPPRMQSCQLISTWRQNVKLQVWNQPNFNHHSIALHNYYHWSHIGPYGPIMK